MVLVCKLFLLKLASFQEKKLNANVEGEVYYLWVPIFAYWLTKKHTHTHNISFKEHLKYLSSEQLSDS